MHMQHLSTIIMPVFGISLWFQQNIALFFFVVSDLDFVLLLLFADASCLILWRSRQEAQQLLGDRATRKHRMDSWNGRGNDNLGWMTFKCTSRSSKVAPIDIASVWFPISCLLWLLPHHTPFLRKLMWNSLMTLKYAQGHWQLYHLKAVVWPRM